MGTENREKTPFTKGIFPIPVKININNCLALELYHIPHILSNQINYIGDYVFQIGVLLCFPLNRARMCECEMTKAHMSKLPTRQAPSYGVQASR